VLRIIAGTLRSRQFIQPPGMITRATKDRVREAIFSAIGPRINGTAVLDLFAGSGAYALEAFSRGAKTIHLNDAHLEAYQTLTANLLKLGIQGAVTTQLDFLTCLNQYAMQKHQFDLIFLDPPYDSKMLEAAYRLIIQADLIKPRGILILESEGPEIDLSAVIFNHKVYNYGRTMVQIAWKKN